MNFVNARPDPAVSAAQNPSLLSLTTPPGGFHSFAGRQFDHSPLRPRVTFYIS